MMTEPEAQPFYHMPKHDVTAALPIVMVAPETIQTNPRLFQFRHSASDPSGIRKSEKIRGRWDAGKHDKPLLLYERQNGELFVVDGHHRLEFARRLNQRFFSQAPKLLKAQILRERDGMTPEQAKIFGAFRNLSAVDIQHPLIGEKQIEAAEVFHDIFKQPDIVPSLPFLPATPDVVQAAKAGRLDDEAFRIATEDLPAQIAIPIAAYTADQAMPDATKVQVLNVIANQLKPLTLSSRQNL